jgi:hypothetical protein
MPQTFSQNGDTLGSMWTFWSSWPSKKPRFLVMYLTFQNKLNQWIFFCDLGQIGL